MAFGRLERHSANAPMSDINMTPLIDVMLVLVVIFIITAPLLASSVRLDLPRTDAATPSETPQALTLSLDRAGQAYLDDKPLAPADLAGRLAQIAARNPDTEVQLRADQLLPYGRVLEVMGIVQKAGLTRIGFIADPSPAKR
ncbi:MAG: biopolymer transporter ExbD [Burkholderiaceae bacterium]